MKQNGNIYTAEDGNFIIRKADSFIMGESIDLGSADSIDNYEEQPYTEESYKAFYESIGVKPHSMENNKNAKKK
jgi:hypothetical protein